MLAQQRTIAKPVSISGIGLHTGTSCTMTFKPAPEKYGIKFIRTDLAERVEIPATTDYVVDIARGTTIAVGEARVHTVEHVLAAIVGMEVDNIIIELNGIEPPIADGSSMPFVEKLREAGFVTQEAPKDYIIIDEPIRYTDEENQVDIVALPLDGYRLTVMVDYQNPALGSQHSGLFEMSEFEKEFAPSRTFCFLSEVEELAAQGLIKGGDLDNAVVIVDHDLDDGDLKKLQTHLKLEKEIKVGASGFLNDKSLRFRNEPVRHKLLDMIGDLALIGAPIKAQILAARPGHKSNIEFAKIIRKLYQQKKLEKKYQFIKKEGIVFDIEAIQRILPHRYPLLLVDKVVHLDMEKKATGIKSVTFNEQFFQGHFEGQRVMPGVLIIEALAQLGGILMLNSSLNPAEKLIFFMGINKARFRRPVVPGDQLILEAEVISKREKMMVFSGKAYVDDKLVAEAELMASIQDKPTQKPE
ncbi:MAG: bifunctional UDP-3-O-[3-hydroxymyristoyl] N-acetylglucosamine deacetylase/3-hydroxyacyl-ACP dehydratase [Melioribacteraceae bacterium]|nr:bifunctional UDP-3-O-[3-hydroxymyristoyl] N-acetylglucosamine deacetylase/3-hydroxyacyl-ACP dehydratase [Melioribacteraceae bacterium]MCF8264053.1 bifunctional UDP-3-O-[3-hydroxymyristoyl] N-acetylglucosamine deacetylase/3-hydroxyacyl-ACP dehydratase [Melioribacteraceae bacterium]MCF8411865.1 bifunctional UDP-3-O-[3-hydroxymyristoyl] N-acetylglucosamine deacetylase/3-hydroxyacyl-ACP dehydratase [Melioribacteraceae bacterium]